MIIPRTYCCTALLSTVLLLAACQQVVTPQGDFVQTNQQVEQKPLSLQFNQGRISGFTGCNRAMGSFTVDKGDLVVSQLASTMMACSEPAMAREQAFHSFLQSKPKLSYDNKQLVLRKDDISYQFSSQP
ncbi:META domain-containing protein [Rheinheimera muenzenbergensis]|uniref:META domain-containing protein n=1 Tax=Rheinheimera muenzenbergensis TaxID=1193628 RepID=A0ABU8C6C8_9GAMM